MKKAAPFALLGGLVLGLIAADLATGGSKKDEQKVETALVQEEEEIVQVSSSTEEVAADSYHAFLEESAEKKNVEAGDLDMLDVAEEAYYRLTNISYPRHNYDTSAFARDENGTLTYTDTDAYTVRHGIDVSEHNGEIDWQQVADAGYSFAFIRLGYRGYEGGVLSLDARYHENIEGATAAGLDVGVYFFAQAIDKNEAVEEAAFVLQTLGGRELQLPVVYDPEAIPFDEARTDDVTGHQFTENTKLFCKAIREAGYQAGYYANLRWEVFMMDMAALEDYTVWYAGYEDTPKTPYAFSFWQYSDSGIVPGITENTDLNIQMIPKE